MCTLWPVHSFRLNASRYIEEKWKLSCMLRKRKWMGEAWTGAEKVCDEERYNSRWFCELMFFPRRDQNCTFVGCSKSNASQITILTYLAHVENTCNNAEWNTEEEVVEFRRVTFYST